MKTVLLIILCSLSLCFINAQPLTSINYSVGEGLPQSQVFAVAQDEKGYMWFGTQGGGLGRFDGKSFQPFLNSTYVSAIGEDVDKTLWIGTTKGAFRKRDFDFEPVQTVDNQVHNFRAFGKTKEGIFIVGSEKGLWQWDEKTQKLRPHPINKDLDKTIVQSFFTDEKGIWIASNRGAFLYEKQGKLTPIPELLGLPIQGICKDVVGNYWCVSYDKGTFILNPKDLKVSRSIIHPDFDNATCCFAAKDGQVWIGTDNKGVIQLAAQDTVWKKLTEADNLPSNNIRQIYQDTWQNIWICTSGGGVSKLLAQNFTHFNTKNGLLDDRIYALTFANDNTIWCAVGNTGVMNYNGSTFQKPANDSLLKNIRVKSLATDKMGRIWLATEGDGLLMMDSFYNQKWTIREGLPSNAYKSVVVDKNNHIWAASTYDGLVHLFQKDDYSFGLEIIKKGIPDLLISTLKVDDDNRMWFGTRNGVLGYIANRKVVKIFGKENGLPAVAIRAIDFDTKGYIHIGTAGEGIFYAPVNAQNMQFSPVKTTKFYAKNIYLLQFDNKDNLWAGSEQGVEKFIFDAKKTVLDIRHFSKNEGFIGIETCQNAAICDALGNLWFGTLNGLTKHIPNNDAQKTSVPKLHFEQISLFYQPLQQTAFASFLLPSGGIKEGLILPYSQNHVSFDFKSVHLNSDAPLQYRWRLKGAETNWSPLSNQEGVNYAKLEPGDYVFMVQATTDGLSFSDPISAPFSVAKPFWRMLWFRLLLLSIASLGVYFLIKYRENRIRQKENALREQLETKNNLLMLEQKALQLQMNPHFIFNILTGIQSLVVSQKTEEARQQISNFAQLMRNILSNSRKPMISLKEEIETLEGYLQIEKQSQKADFDYYFHLSDNINTEDVQLPPMLLQPFVENALIHGISRLEHKGKIDISFDLKGETLHCCITDNGIGREKSAELKGLSPKKYQSAAIDITTERLKALANTDLSRGNREGGEPLTISDILDEKGLVAGTKVVVLIGVELF